MVSPNNTLQKAYHAALRLLNYRMRSKTELMQRLAEKEFDSVIINNVISKLEENNFVDDEAFAKAFINDKIHFRYLGPVALRQELSLHQLNKELVETLIVNAYQENPEKELVQRLIEKRNIEKRQTLTQKEKNNLLNYLYRRGHRWDVIKVVLDEWKI